MDISHLLAGTKILKKVKSPINGELTVVRDIAWGTYIKGGGLTQSGGVAKKVWETSLHEAKKGKFKVKSALVLGLGGGAIVEVIEDNWSEAHVVGVDLDEIIVNLGKKYLSLSKTRPEIHIADAEDFIEAQGKEKKKFDLVCIDTYLGDQFPKKFETNKFISSIKTILNKEGKAVFNRLYYDEKKHLAHAFFEKLEKVFTRVEAVRPEANIMYICSK